MAHDDNMTPPAWHGRRRLLAWCNTILMTLFVFLLVVGANVLSNRYFFRVDITREQSFHLTDKTVAILKNLSKDVNVYVYPSGIMAQMGGQIVAHQNAWKKIDDMLDEYASWSDRIVVRPMTENEAERTKKTEKEFPPMAPNDILFACEGRYDVVNVNAGDMYQADAFSGRIVKFMGEALFTNAVKKVTTERTPTIYFTRGHGEIDFVSQDHFNISQLRHALVSRENCKVETVNIADAGIPRECDLLCIVGPQRPFLPLEIGVMEGYLRRGGRILVTLGTYYIDHGLDDFLRAWGIKPHRDMICDDKSFPKAYKLFEKRRWPTVAEGENFTPDHPINARLGGLMAIFPFCSSLETVSVTGDDGMTIRTDVVAASDPAFAESDLTFLRRDSGLRPTLTPEIDRQGRLPMLVTSEAVFKTDPAHPLKARIVVCGSTDFAMAYLSYFGQNQAQEVIPTDNLHYLLNCFQWLLDKEAEIAIPEKNFKQTPLNLKVDEATRMQILSIFIFPALGIVLGVIVWLFRRK